MKKIITLFMAVFMLSCSGKKHEEKNVNFYMWGGSQEVNRFVDENIAKEIEKKGIKLKRVPISDIKDAVNKLIIEKKAGKKEGGIDILWVNGESFKLLKEAQLLSNLDGKIKGVSLLKSSTTEKDFGESIDSLEIPWGEVQFNFIGRYSEGQPFTDSKSLMEYVKGNRGRFTYPNVSDFTGSAFVRNIAIDILGEENIRNMTNEELKVALNTVWDYFKEMKGYLWREGTTYPESEGNLDTLYAKEEIDISMGYTINKVSQKIKNGQFSDSSKSFLLDKGTLFNNHYLAIPINSPHKEAAYEVIEYLISPEAQLLKQDPKNWGDFTVLDLEKIESKEREEFEKSLDDGKIVSPEKLKEKRVGELPSDKAKIIDEGWRENIGKL